jgi:hypothetical protein
MASMASMANIAIMKWKYNVNENINININNNGINEIINNNQASTKMKAMAAYGSYQ